MALQFELGIALNDSSRKLLLDALHPAASARDDGKAIAALLPALHAIAPLNTRTPGAELFHCYHTAQTWSKLSSASFCCASSMAHTAFPSLFTREQAYLKITSRHTTLTLSVSALLLRDAQLDYGGAMFEQLWTADVNLTRLRASLPPQVIRSALIAGTIERLGLANARICASSRRLLVDRGHTLKATASFSMSVESRSGIDSNDATWESSLHDVSPTLLSEPMTPSALVLP